MRATATVWQVDDDGPPFLACLQAAIFFYLEWALSLKTWSVSYTREAGLNLCERVMRVL